MSTLRKTEERRVRSLLFGCTEVLPEGFRVELSSSPELWSALVKSLGSARLCAICAAALEQAYEAKFHEPFLFSARCMAFELRYHINAYLWAKGQKRIRHITTLLLSRTSIIRNCHSIEIDRTDVYRFSQRLLFRYFFGIRKGFRRTARDPYAVAIGKRYLRVPFSRPHKNSRF